MIIETIPLTSTKNFNFKFKFKFSFTDKKNYLYNGTRD